MTNPELQSEQITPPEALPLDGKLVGGIALRGALTEDHFETITDKIEGAFDQLRESKKKEFGRCIAYAIGISDEDRDKVMRTLVTSAASQNHGVVTMFDNHIDEADQTFWWGQDDKSVYVLMRKSGHIVMDDGTIPEGEIFSLVGANHNQKEEQS